jgi:hypothetical protein
MLRLLLVAAALAAPLLGQIVDNDVFLKVDFELDEGVGDDDDRLVDKSINQRGSFAQVGDIDFATLDGPQSLTSTAIFEGVDDGLSLFFNAAADIDEHGCCELCCARARSICIWARVDDWSGSEKTLFKIGKRSASTSVCDDLWLRTKSGDAGTLVLDGEGKGRGPRPST